MFVVGGLVCLVAILLPDLFGGTTARRISRDAREALDPTRAYHDAKTADGDSPTVANGMRLAQAAAGHGRHDQA